MTQPTLYLETSFISYLTSRPSRDIIVASRQQLSEEWWDTQRTRFTIYISPLVVQEASAGDSLAVQRRLAVIQSLPLLEIKTEMITLAEALLQQKALPEKALEDALHIAIAAFHHLDYLLTWNYKHLANAEKRSLIEQIIEANGLTSPVICTPTELMGE